MTRGIVVSVLAFCALVSSGCVTVHKGNNQSHGEIKAASGIPQLRRPIEDVAHYGSTHLWIVTANGDLLRTEDGGITWHKTTSESVGGFERVSFIDGDRGWAINSRGQVLSTQDGGRLWGTIVSLGRPLVVDQIKFVDLDTGWFLEPFSVRHTTDGGVSWVKKDFETPLADASFTNQQVAWVFDQEKRLFQTINGGQTWQRYTTRLGTGDIQSMFCIEPSKGWLACRPNQIHRTEDGGKTWEMKAIPGNKAILDSLYFKDDNEGWGAGSEETATETNSRGFRAILIHTLDGGKTWEIQPVDIVDVGFQSVYF
ncbi:MAG: YCF48-related protein, partial [Blastocatellia bacterium]